MTDIIGISPYRETNRFFRAMRQLAGWKPVSLLYARILPPVDRFASRVTGDTTTLAGLTTGLQVLLLTTTGAKTGAVRTQPVLYLAAGNDFVVVASNWGQERNPSWYYNLRANPDARVALSGATHDVTAHEVTGPQRELYWQQACLMYPAWDRYKARAPHRQFPVMLLSRKAAPGTATAG